MSLQASPDIVKDHQRQCIVKVEGFDLSLLELYQLYFENPRKVGGIVTDFQLGDNKDVIYITFQTPEEAEQVTKLIHTVGGKQLQLTLAPLDDPLTSCPCTVKITGCDTEMQELYELYFENPQKGGGSIKDLVVNKDEQAIYITFEDPETARNVCSKTHKVGGCDLEVTLQFPSRNETDMARNQENSRGPLRTVEFEVDGSLQSEERYLLYFEAQRHGGGEVEDVNIDHQKGFVYVTFIEADVAARVAGQKHVIYGQPTTVNLYVPPIPRPTDPVKLLFRNVSKTTTHDCLELFVEHVTGLEPTDLIHADNLEDVLAVFREEPDFKKVQEMCHKRSLEGKCLSVSKVPVSNCILVQNLSVNTTKDTVLYYFESHRRSGGGSVEKVDFDGKHNRCLVFFQDHKVVDGILTKVHTLDGQELRVKRYLECLGPSGGSTDFR